MSAVHILSRRIILDSNSFHDVSYYMKDLHRLVTTRNGFIYAKSYWNKDLTELYTIHKWSRIGDWEEWKYSEDRKSILENYSKCGIEEVHEPIYKYYDSEMFLL